MRVAMLTTDYLPSIGGIASHIVEISRALACQGHAVQVWHYDVESRPAVSLDTVPTVRLEPQRARLWPHSFWTAPRLAKLVRAKREAFNAEIIHCHTLFAAMVVRSLGASDAYRRILTNHSSGYLGLVTSRLGRLRARLFYSRVDGVLAPSEELAERSRFLNVPPDRCRYVPNGVDPDRFAPGDKGAARDALGLPQERPIMLSTRRFAEKNGLRYLALALADLRKEVPDVLCVFCGNATDAIELPTVERIVAERGLSEHVRFEGAIPNDRIPTYLHACDVVVLPSLMEATSISGLEAMAAGKALVGTRVGGIPALIEDGVTGCLVEAADAHSLAVGLLRVLCGDQAQTMGELARQRVLERFSWSAIAKLTSAFYREILERPPLRR